VTIVMNAPDKIGKYRITGVIGEGASGVVYKAFDAALQRIVAVKSLRRAVSAEGADAREFADRLREQAQAVARLAHPNIVAIHEIDESGGRAFIAMEHVAGLDLAQWLAATPVPSHAIVLQVMEQLLDALEIAHRSGVRHGDLRPTNIIVTGAGLIKVTDFGLARAQGRAGALAGGAPEYQSGRLLDHRVDIYGAGALLYRMLAGRDASELLSGATEIDPLRAASNVAEAHRRAAFDAVAARAMAHDPNQRFANAADFRAALRAATQVRLPEHGTNAVSLDSTAGAAPDAPHMIVLGESPSAPESFAVRQGLLRPVPAAGQAPRPAALTIAIPDRVLAMPSFDPWARSGAPGQPAADQSPADVGPSDNGYMAFRGQVDRDRRASVVSAATAATAALSAAAEAAERARVRRPPPDPSMIPTLLSLPAAQAPFPSGGMIMSAPIAAATTHERITSPVPLPPVTVDLELPAPGEGIPAEALRRVLRVLSTHFGEIAGDVLKQVGARATSIPELHEMLLERAGTNIDKKTLAKQLRAVAKLPL
jgi:serine/threonine protein kinase